MAGMVNHPPAARGTWVDTWHEEEVSERPPGWVCDWRVLENLQTTVLMVIGRLQQSMEWRGLVSWLLALFSAYFGPKMVSVIKQVVLLVRDIGGVMGKNLTSGVALDQPPIRWLPICRGVGSQELSSLDNMRA